jgi:hypothetical protein
LFRSLILIFFISTNIWAGPTDNELALFSRSNQWLKLLYYKNEKSLVIGDRYLLSPKGRVNALQELLVSIDKLKLEKYSCLFPARRILINKQWPNLLPEFQCQDFQEFKMNLRAGELYLVFASVYPNNPASMFGHTFLRISSLESDKTEETQNLIGYSMGFQAITDPRDNALEYTFKGLFGGYDALMEVKPYYMDLGIYNNGESRDLWEYKIPLTDDQRELMVAHMWEILNSVGFPYYFFKENCSTFALRFLEVLSPEINFQSKNDFFVVPQVTLRDVVKTFQITETQFQMSIKNQMKYRFDNLSKNQKNIFLSHQKTLDPEILDIKVDYWKYKNYKKKTQLSKKEKEEMYEIYSNRAKVADKISVIPVKNKNELQFNRPDIGHDISKVKFALGSPESQIGVRYGFHEFSDPMNGFDDSSYISLLNLNYGEKTKNYEVLDLLSLQSFYSFIPSISWRVKANYYEHNENSYNQFLVGLGFSKLSFQTKFYFLITVNSFAQGSTHLGRGGINWGVREELKEAYWYLESYLMDSSNYFHHHKTSYMKKLNDIYGGVSFVHQFKENKLFLEFASYF